MSKLNRAKKSLKKFFIRFASIVDSGDNPEAMIPLFKSAEDKKDDKGGVENMTLEEILKGLPEEDRKTVQTELDKIGDLETANSEQATQIDGLQKEVDELKKEPDKPADEDASDEELLKSADPKVQEMLKKERERAEKAESEAEKFKKEKEEEQEKLRKEELTKEAEKYGNIGAKKEDIVEILTKIDGDEELMEKVKGIFGACNEALKDNKLMKTIGSDDADARTAKEELADKVKEAMDKDENMTKEKAESKILKSDPDLHQRIRDEE